MSHGNNNNQNRSNSSWRSRSHRSNNRFAARSSGQVPLKVSCNGIGKQYDANVSTTLVNGIKQGLLASITPSDSPVNERNCSPLHQRNNIGCLPDFGSAYWQMDFNWIASMCDLQPNPKCIPTLNGTPYTGGPPTTSPSPVGSSRCSTYSNSSPTQPTSGDSSPMLSTCFKSGVDGRRRCSAEEMRCKANSRSPDELLMNYQDNGRASSSQSPEEPNYNFNPIGSRNVDSRLSDDVPPGYYPTCRSSESRSSEDLSIENIMGEFRISSPEYGNDANCNSESSGSTRGKESTPERAYDSSSDIQHSNILGNMVGTTESVQETPLMKEISCAITALEMMTFNPKKMPMPNQLTLPSGNQIPTGMLPNRQLSITKQMSIANAFPLSGQLAVPAPADDKPLASSSPLMFLNQRVVPDHSIRSCAVHNGSQRYYCETCTKLFCNECGLQSHVGHVTAHLLDATEAAHKQAERVLTECRYGISTIREDIDKGLMAAQTLDIKARDAITSVRELTRQLTEALRIRERQLVESIEITRQSKQTALQLRDEGLKFGLNRLNQALEKLTRSVEASSRTTSPLDLYIAKDMASAQIFHVKSIRNNLPPPEEHYIRFQVMDSHIIDSVRNLGNVFTGNGHIGDRRPLARPTIPSLSPPMAFPRARAIAGHIEPISITKNRRIVNNSPYLEIGKPLMSIGCDLGPEDNLCRPWGVACDREGHIVIADRSNNRIQIFRTNGSFVRRFGSHGTGPGQFDRPAGIAVDSRRRIVVADKDNHRIQVLTMEGDFLLAFGEKGTTPGLFNYPWDVATNDICQIVVSDTRNHRIQMFSAEGIFLRRFGFEAQPQLWKCLDSPRGVAFNRDGNIVVSDFNNHRIIVVDADFDGAKLLGCDNLTPHPMPPKSFLRPQGVAVDDSGHVVVCDSRNHRVQILDSNGVCRWRFGSQGSGPEQMDRPSGVAITPDGKIVIVDFGNNRVLVF